MIASLAVDLIFSQDAFPKITQSKWLLEDYSYHHDSAMEMDNPHFHTQRQLVAATKPNQK